MKSFQLSFVISLLLFASAISAQENSFTLSTSKDTVLLGNSLNITFTITNLEGDFEAPDLSALNLRSGPNVSTSMQYINGQMTRSSSYSYYVEPLEIGEYIIEPGYVIGIDSTRETEIKKILVLPNPEGIVDQPKRESSFFDFPSFNFDFAFPEIPREKSTPPSDTLSKRKLKRI